MESYLGWFAVPPTREDNEEHHNSNSRSSGTRGSGVFRRLFGPKSKKRMPSPPRPQEHVLGTTTETVGTPKLAVKKPTPGIETIDQREEATIRDDYVPRVAEEELQGPVESTGGIESDSPARESGYPPSYGEPPPLPQAPANCFPRDEIETRLLDHLDDLASIVLSGAVGIGKTMITLTILRHDRVKTKFGDSRYFMRCNNLASLESFLERLSDAIGSFPQRAGNSCNHTWPAVLRSY